MPRALLALAIGAFGIGTSEFVIMGMLPQVADEFSVSVAAVVWRGRGGGFWRGRGGGAA